MSQANRVDIASYQEREVGKRFKGSKVEFVFEFFVNGMSQVAKIVRSFFSGKIRVYVNEQLVHNEEK